MDERDQKDVAYLVHGLAERADPHADILFHVVDLPGGRAALLYVAPARVVEAIADRLLSTAPEVQSTKLDDLPN